MRDQDLTRFLLEDGTVVSVEVDRSGDRDYTDVGFGRRAVDAVRTLDDAMDQIRRAANVLLRPMTRVEPRPDEVEVCFGVRMTADAGAVIADQSSEGNFAIRLVWRSRDSDEGPSAPRPPAGP
ncbi:CU044_2847 family protein [Streptomyces sp. NPDC101151]|uniref:CU044_2847 family protein n=1 Tax=Streptomyces sp. NPDC101151 TaxID=3366115 RepID=UPI003812E3F2